MRALVSVLLMSAAAIAAPVSAQEASSREARCWIGSSTFSPGASMHVGTAVATCDAGSGWVTSESPGDAAGCLLEGELSSVGAVVGIRNNATLVLQCQPAGTWETMPVEGQPEG